MEWIRLVGIPVVVLGFALRLRVSLTVLLAGIATAFAAHMAPIGGPDAPGLLDTLGKSFVDNRIITLFVLVLPAIGLSERFGLQEQARALVARFRAVTAGRLQFIYHLFRVAVVALGIRLGSGHVTFSRPLVVPMALEAAGLPEGDEAHVEEVDRVKAASGASENYANFFGQNLFPGAAGVALIVNTLKSADRQVDATAVALFTIPVAIASLVLAAVQYLALDRWMRRRLARAERPENR